jgi:WD40 repeat protein
MSRPLPCAPGSRNMVRKLNILTLVVGILTLWGCNSHCETHTLCDVHRDMTCLACDPGCLHIATGSSNGSVKVWDIEGRKTPETLRVSEDVQAICYSRCGRLLACGGTNGVLTVWDSTSLTVLRSATLRGRCIVQIVYALNDRMLVIADAAGALVMYDADTLAEIGSLRLGGMVRSVAISPSGDVLAAGDINGNVRLWDLNTRKKLYALKNECGAVNAVAFSPDGKLLATGCKATNHASSNFGTITIWCISTGDRVASWEGDRNSVLALAFLNDRCLSSAGLEGSVRFWDVMTHRLLFECYPSEAGTPHVIPVDHMALCGLSRKLVVSIFGTGIIQVLSPPARLWEE